jgi:DNA-binding XRE family transcriptional regulator
MAERDPTCKKQQRRQPKVATRRLGRGPGGRGVYLPGLWSVRVCAGLTQRELAGLIGSYQSTICALESQNRGAYPKTLRLLCDALGAEPTDLLTAQEEETPKEK